MRLLDLFCGAGGAAMGYHRAGFEVWGVDIEPQPNYPFKFVQGNAMLVDEFLAVGAFDAIHASPPCQAYSRLTADKDKHPDLVANTRAMLQGFERPYVIENVPGAPLRNPVQLCGSAFGLGVIRHRLFESDVALMSPGCAHGQMPFKYDVYEHGRWYKGQSVKVYGSGGGKAMQHWKQAMDIDWMTDQELSQAIPPAYTEHIGGYLLSHLEQVVYA